MKRGRSLSRRKDGRWTYPIRKPVFLKTSTLWRKRIACSGLHENRLTKFKDVADLQHPTHEVNRPHLLVLIDESIPHGFSCTKKAVAFFGMSFSIRSLRTSDFELVNPLLVRLLHRLTIVRFSASKRRFRRNDKSSHKHAARPSIEALDDGDNGS